MRRTMLGWALLGVLAVSGAQGCGSDDRSSSYVGGRIRDEVNPASEPEVFRRDFAYDGGGLLEAGPPVDEDTAGPVISPDAGGAGGGGADASVDPNEQTPSGDPDIALGASVLRIVYDAAHDEAHAIAPDSGELLRIDLQTRTVTQRTSLSITPTDLCVDTARASVFLVGDSSSGVIVELGLANYDAIREIPWTAGVYASFQPTDSPHFHVRCTASRLLLVDAEWQPGLWTYALDTVGAQPENHSGTVSAVGDLAYDESRQKVFVVQQAGWSAGYSGSDIYAHDASTLTQLSTTAIGYPDFPRDPLDAPLVHDGTLGLIAAKHFVFDADDLSQPLHTFVPGELVLALDASSGRIATTQAVYGSTFTSIAPLVVRNAPLAFFDESGVLYAYSSAAQGLYVQEP